MAMDAFTTAETIFRGWKEDLAWWQTGIVYQIYPRSFQDSNHDGVGDLNGILSRLDHLEYLGVDIVWLSPIYPSPMADFGYDVSDYKDIEPAFGTLRDFDRLIESVHDRGMRLVMDYIPNHTSDEHRWFEASRRRQQPYSDYYVWHDGKEQANGSRAPPNNWLSVFGGPAWTWDELRQQFYFHQYDPKQPDLNFRNPAVRKAMEDVLKFWLDRGVDGFRVDTVGTIFEAEHLQDEPPSGLDLPADRYKSLKHVYTYAQPETLDLVREWRQLCNEYEKQHTRDHIFIVTEMYDDTLHNCLKFYDVGAVPFNFSLVRMQRDWSARDIAQRVHKWLHMMPEGKWPNWVLGNHDKPRVASRKGARYADALNALLLLLPGTPTTYQGEELCLLNIHLTFEQTVDPAGRNAGPEGYLKASRDVCRAPMQWDGSRHAGFSSADSTWLPVHPDYATCNAQVQKAAASGRSHVQLYRQLAKLRREASFQRGTMQFVRVTEDMLAFARHSARLPGYVVLLNFGEAACRYDEKAVSIEGHSYTTGVVVFVTADVDLRMGEKIKLNDITLNPGDGIVVKLTE